MRDLDAIALGYPVLSVCLELVEKRCEELGRPMLPLDMAVTRALGSIITASKKSLSVTIWGREAVGMDATNSPALLLFLHLVAPGNMGQLPSRIHDALNAGWFGCCRFEGIYLFVGGEKPLWGIEAKKVMTYH
jgi:hypothetical protein